MSSEDYVRHIFSFGRDLPFPSIYPEIKTAVTSDVLEAGWVVAFVTMFFCFLILVPAVANKEKHLYVIRITLIAFIGLAIMLCNFGQEWEIGSIKSMMYYKAGSKEEIDATVGVKLGLRSVNVTLYALPGSLHGDLVGEKINYNERFTWAWEQGRAGFGPFAGQIQRDFREGQLKGLPYPILWVAEFFTFDGEGLRLGRHYRHAGWYSHIFVWCAFVCWLLSMILFKIYILYGAVLLSILGSCLVSASIVWASIRNPLELAVVFNNEEGGILTTKFGFHWYLSLLVGLFCLVSGILVAALDMLFHDELCLFFGLNPFTIIDEEYSEEDVEDLTDQTLNEMEMKNPKEFTGRRQKTVRYKPRGTKKIWKNAAVTEPEIDNNAYFNAHPSNSPILHQMYTSGQQYQGQGQSQQQYPYQQQPQGFQQQPQPQPRTYPQNIQPSSSGRPYYPTPFEEGVPSNPVIIEEEGPFEHEPYFDPGEVTPSPGYLQYQQEQEQQQQQEQEQHQEQQQQQHQGQQQQQQHQEQQQQHHHQGQQQYNYNAHTQL